jgi:DNA polymerase III delta prime subunit
MYFHPSTEATLQHLLTDLPQSLLISGPHGIGLSAIHTHLSSQLGIVAQVVLPEKDEKIDLDKGVISVDSIRRIYDLTKTIETNKRIIVIDYAERMGSQAQNAFLKLLEEPGQNTHFILLTHERSKLLPTILSRTQDVELRTITTQQTEALLDELNVTHKQKRAQLLFMAEGLPAEITRLVEDVTYFEQRAQIVRDARTFLQGSEYDRIKLSFSYKDDRQRALLLLSDALNLLKNNVDQGKTELLPKIDMILKAYERVSANGNVRLQLAAAMV